MGYSTLMLNADFRPLRTESIRSGAVKCLLGKADFIEGFDPARFLHSPSITVPVPAVARLVEYSPYTPKPRTTKLSSRKSIMNRDNNECVYCGNKATTIDHVIPSSKGGTNEYDNLVACCRPCNEFKGNRSLEELQWDIGMDLMPPKQHHILRGSISQEVFDRWVRPTLSNRSG